ncbi:MAG: type II toxin-antitoxin system Phd/YefM family antitoxin [Snowella sp.]|nr:type II toxin-antitoxin system Phd/YefM family antitoxin [Snowella sp.]
MNIYTLTQTRNQHGEVFDKAQVEPVLITKQKRPSHVILSADVFQRLVTRLEELEDRQLGQAADGLLSQSSLVGVEDFVQALEKLANAEA